MRRALRCRLATVTVLSGVIAATLVAGGSGVASAAGCPTVPSTVVVGIQISDPACGFAPVDGSRVYAGILHGSAYRIEVPSDWNGDLVMYAHGYAGTGSVVAVSNPPIRTWYVLHGYAWAASSYRENGYNVGDGVEDTHDLMVHFSGLTHHRAPRETFMTGVSMGGEITAAEIEAYRGQYVGAQPSCGVLGGNDLFSYYLGATAAAAALADAADRLQYPLTAAAGAAYAPAFDQLIAGTVDPALGIGVGAPRAPTAAGAEWMSIIEQLSGGARPGFPSALVSFWDTFGFAPLSNIPFLLGLYPGTTGGTIGYADGNVASNTTTTYSTADGTYPAMSQDQLNASVLRVAASNTPTTNPHRTQLPDIAGDPGIPVLSLHDVADLFVPLSMDQIYDRQMIGNGQGSLFVDRAIRGVGHCDFSPNELSQAFSDLVAWVNNGTHPEGDAILDPSVVAAADFGCQFTDQSFPHVWFDRPCSTS
jgi:hypothetical protein